MTTFTNSYLYRKSLAFAIISILGSSSAWAANLSVNSLLDVTVSGDGSCTLREAIANANIDSDISSGDCLAGSGADTITFVNNGTIVLGSTLTISDLDSLTIDGLNKNISLSGNYSVRLIQLNSSASLTLKNLTIANGFVTTNGGGISTLSGSNLAVFNSTFTGNTASGNGGAIDNAGTLTVVNTTFTGNQGYFGGAIKNNANMNIVNSTIVGNSAVTRICPAGFVCTLVIADGGGFYNTGTFNLENSIVIGNTADQNPSDISGWVTTAHHNLLGEPWVYYLWNGLDPVRQPVNSDIANGNFSVIDPAQVLELNLSNTGGPTDTLALIAGSPAIDAADDGICANPLLTNNRDQRGVSRPQAGHCDIGAFELAAQASADLTVTQTAAPNPVMVRDKLTWTINVTNNGTLAATGVKLFDTLPPSGLSSISAKSSQGTCGSPVNSVITCNLGTLANAQSVTVSVSGIPTKTGSLNNQLAVSGNEFDVQLANNSSAQTVTVQPLLCNGLVPTIVGTPGPDKIVGSKRRDIIQGLGGNDTISGGSDNDIICGGEGQDVLNGDAGNDTLNGEAGTDSCNGGAGTDTSSNCEASISIP